MAIKKKKTEIPLSKLAEADAKRDLLELETEALNHPEKLGAQDTSASEPTPEVAGAIDEAMIRAFGNVPKDEEETPHK